MKAKSVALIVAGCVIGLGGWLGHEPGAQAGEVPEKYRKTVRKGLDYLAEHQHKDGHWEGDDGKFPLATTALVGMALLMDKEGSAAKGRYREHISRAVDWLMNQSRPQRGGLIHSEHASELDRYMYGHGLAVLFLASKHHLDSLDRVYSKKHRDFLDRAVNYTVKAQSVEGGWYRTSRAEGHDFDEILATVIQMHTFFCHGCPDPMVPRKADAYLKMTLQKYEKDGNAKASDNSAFEMVAAYTCCWFEKEARIEKWFDSGRKAIPTGRAVQFGRDELCHYFCALAAYSHGRTYPDEEQRAWNSYKSAMFDHLQSSQNKDGSWPAGKSVISVGPLYSTAVWCTILQLDTHRHPIWLKVAPPVAGPRLK